ncbi:RNA polymerase sigma-70 factor [Butyricimonas faecihominis]|uniref:RNA polymerase sigma-70 factor n=1 Tax=Butyricimonas faecihominis TaxID=1472416 RepID=UPI00267068D2|nr:RNA polymerase sigma-70 factor [Butyricimonas faecihominis]
MVQDELLIEQLNQKQVGAFKILFDRFYRYLVLYAMKWVERQEIAEDVVQDLFVQVWERDTIYSSYYGFKNFLYNSVKNASLDYLKHKEVEGKYVRYTLRTSETGEMPELEVMKDEVYRRLYQVLDELPKRCQEVFKHYLEGKKNSEIAEILQISELTVKTQKRNAIVYLRKRLGGVYVLYVLFKVGFM